MITVELLFLFLASAALQHFGKNLLPKTLHNLFPESGLRLPCNQFSGAGGGTSRDMLCRLLFRQDQPQGQVCGVSVSGNSENSGGGLWKDHGTP